jgi:hypothetical protein
MDSNVTPASEIPYDLVRIAVRDNLPPVIEATNTLDETMDAIQTKLNKLQDVIDTAEDEANNQEMTDAVNGLLRDVPVVGERFKVWHEKLNLACVLIGLVYTQRAIAPEAR